MVPRISARIFIIPKLQNIYCELFSFWIEHLPYCYFVRHYYYFLIPDWSLWEHLSRALPTEMIFHQLRSIHSDRLVRDNSVELMLDTLDIIIKWLQVSVRMQLTKPLRLKSDCVQGLGSERPSDLYGRFQGELLRYKALHKLLRWSMRFECITSYACDRCNQYSKTFS